MHQDIFGNLADWGGVLEHLEELTRSGDLEKHQESLMTLLRYPYNWRLREAALEAACSVRRPLEPLVRQISRIMMDDGLYYQVRVLAAEALGACLDHLAESTGPVEKQLRRYVQEQMHTLLDGNEVPVLHQAARRILPKIE